jgi:glycyl-tRNA synthetase beta chain
MANFLLEVGTEDLPAGFVRDALQQWQERIPAALTAAALTYDRVDVYVTPRRIAVLISNLPERQADRVEEVKGPPASAAFKDGQLTPAGAGFAKKQGVEAIDLTIQATDKGDFVFVNKQISGRNTTDILTELIPEWIFKLEGKRMMRWADGDLKFSRPIRWLIALWDDRILPIEITNSPTDRVVSDRISFAHRVLHPAPVTVARAEDYVSTLDRAFVKVDRQQRSIDIQAQVKAAADQLGGVTPIYPDLLEEVIDLVEYPTAVIGKFDRDFLQLPSEVITTVMVTHQRYFPVFSDATQSQLLPYFITISNGDPAKSDLIAEGNGRVVRARLADGKYFYDADLAQPLADYLPKLETVTFQADLGSMKLKVDRIVNNAKFISDRLGVSTEDRTQIERAALLSKTDLVTQMVGEFPELQGIMGGKYAAVNGEDPAVAKAIIEHYQPRNAEDHLPTSLAGRVVGIADRLDTIVSIFGLGMLPTGSSDPFALRRAANAIINIAWDANLELNLRELLAKAIGDFTAIRSTVDRHQLKQQLEEFSIQRLRSLLQEDRGIDYDLVNAILGDNDPEYTDRALSDLLDTRDRALFLQKIRNNGDLEKIYPTINRSARLAAQGTLNTQQLDPITTIDPNLFQKSSEQAVYDGLQLLLPQTESARQNRNYQQLVDAMAGLTESITNFFDGEDSVLVMDNDPQIKANRLNLLGLVRNHARVLADFGAIVKS